jgi:hypothetical protein
MHRATMTELIERYGIKGKRVLGVGPGDCAQEFWFHDSGNSLFLIDIDENGGLEPRLRSIASADPSAPDQVTYVIGDARHVSGWLNAKFDVIFTSGFTPDEGYRAETLKEFGTVVRSSSELTPLGVWPPEKGPLSTLCEEIINGGLADGGLFIALSYASGPDVIRSRNYVPALVEQLDRLGLKLLELHCLASAPGVHLIVALRASDTSLAARRQAELAARPPLSAMHARTTFDHTPIRVEPGPARLGKVGDATVASRIWKDLADKLTTTVGAALDRFAPRAETAYYAGEFIETEGFYLLHRGLAVDFGWGAALGPPEAALRNGLVHRSGRVDPQSTMKPHDLCFLSFLAEDEAQRIDAVQSKRPGASLLAPATRAAIGKLLRPGGTLLYHGRTGGIDPTYDRTYAERLRSELRGEGLQCLEIYCLAAVPGIFFFAAVAGLSPALPSPAATTVFRFFPSAAVDNTAVRLYPTG